MDRRRFLALPGLGVLGALLGACAADPAEPRVRSSSRLVSYGEDPSQAAELFLPDGAPRGVVVVIHGGFWKAAYDRSPGPPPAASPADRGWAAWNLEYRRVGNGGGAPATLDDVRWMLPLPWVLGGGIGLVAATVASRRQAQAEAVRPADHTPYGTPTDTSTDTTTDTITEENR